METDDIASQLERSLDIKALKENILLVTASRSAKGNTRIIELILKHSSHESLEIQQLVSSCLPKIIAKGDQSSIEVLLKIAQMADNVLHRRAAVKVIGTMSEAAEDQNMELETEKAELAQKIESLPRDKVRAKELAQQLREILDKRGKSDKRRGLALRTMLVDRLESDEAKIRHELVQLRAVIHGVESGEFAIKLQQKVLEWQIHRTKILAQNEPILRLLSELLLKEIESSVQLELIESLSNLSERGNQNVLEAMLMFLDREDNSVTIDVRCRAIALLGKISPKGHEKALLCAIRSLKWGPSVGMRGVEATQQFAEHCASNEAIALLLRTLESSSQDIGLVALKMLLTTSDPSDAQAINGCLQAFVQGIPHVRKLASQGLTYFCQRNFGHPKIIGFLILCLETENELEIILNAIELLVALQTKDAGALQAIAKCMETVISTIRLKAIAAISKLLTPPLYYMVQITLLQILQSPDRCISRAAMEALMHIRNYDEHLNELIAIVESHSQSDIKEAAFEVLFVTSCQSQLHRCADRMVTFDSNLNPSLLCSAASSADKLTKDASERENILESQIFPLLRGQSAAERWVGVLATIRSIINDSSAHTHGKHCFGEKNSIQRSEVLRTLIALLCDASEKIRRSSSTAIQLLISSDARTTVLIDRPTAEPVYGVLMKVFSSNTLRAHVSTNAKDLVMHEAQTSALETLVALEERYATTHRFQIPPVGAVVPSYGADSSNDDKTVEDLLNSAIIKISDKSSQPLRAAKMKALGQLILIAPSSNLIAHLKEGLKDQSAEVRLAALAGIMGTDQNKMSDHIQILATMLHDSDSRIRRTSSNSLISFFHGNDKNVKRRFLPIVLGQSCRPEISSFSITRDATLDFLARIPGETFETDKKSLSLATTIAIQCLNDPHENIRDTAVEVLKILKKAYDGDNDHTIVSHLIREGFPLTENEGIQMSWMKCLRVFFEGDGKSILSLVLQAETSPFIHVRKNASALSMEAKGTLNLSKSLHESIYGITSRDFSNASEHYRHSGSKILAPEDHTKLHDCQLLHCSFDKSDEWSPISSVFSSERATGQGLCSLLSPSTLLSLPPKNAVDAVLQCLLSDNSIVRQSTLSLLEKLPASAVSSLCTHLASTLNDRYIEAAEKRAFILKALLKLAIRGNRIVTALFLRSLEDETQPIRQIAYESLYKIVGDDDIDAIMYLIEIMERPRERWTSNFSNSSINEIKSYAIQALNQLSHRQVPGNVLEKGTAQVISFLRQKFEQEVEERMLEDENELVFEHLDGSRNMCSRSEHAIAAGRWEDARFEWKRAKICFEDALACKVSDDMKNALDAQRERLMLLDKRIVGRLGTSTRAEIDSKIRKDSCEKKDMNKRDGQGWAALHYASRWGMNETVQALIDAGAGVNIGIQGGTWHGRTPYDIAASEVMRNMLWCKGGVAGAHATYVPLFVAKPHIPEPIKPVVIRNELSLELQAECMEER